MAYTPDTKVWPILEALKECLCTTLREAELLPGNCFCGILPGSDVPFDYQNGMAWVRLTDASPSTVFPAAAEYRRGCGSPLSFGVEVGALNCIPGLSATGTFPSAAVREEATRVQVATMMKMREAIVCCMPKELEIFLGAYAPVGPEGSVVGGTWTASISEVF